jgi:nucleoside 2-deoxyribosyltransferase
VKPFKKSVYLAGAISYFYNTNQPKRATAWREKASETLEQFNIKCFDPCKEPVACWEYPQEGLIKQNYFYLNNCDIVLVNLDMINDSIGTVWELSMAWRDHKSVVAFGTTPWLDRPHMRSLIDVRFDTLDKALDYIVDMYML